MNGNGERMRRGSLAGQKIGEVEQRSRTPGTETNVGFTGKKRAEKEETAKDKGGLRVGFCIAFLKGVG